MVNTNKQNIIQFIEIFYTLNTAFYLQPEESTSQVRLRVIAGHNLAKKDIFGARLVIHTICHVQSLL